MLTLVCIVSLVSAGYKNTCLHFFSFVCRIQKVSGFNFSLHFCIPSSGTIQKLYLLCSRAFRADTCSSGSPHELVQFLYPALRRRYKNSAEDTTAQFLYPAHSVKKIQADIYSIYLSVTLTLSLNSM